MASFNLKEPSCKLCLEGIVDNNFKDDLAKDKLDNHLLGLKFDEESKHRMCNSCRQKLNAALEFKSTCLNTENTINSYVDYEKILQLDLREVYIRKKESKQVMSDLNDQKVCRLCMQLVGRDFRYINDEELDSIQKFVPEMNINIIKDPVVCKQCFDSLNTHSSFLKSCFQVDEKIGNICVDSATESRQTNNGLSPYVFVKTESLDEELYINDFEMSVKVEPLEIKSEESEEKSDTSLCGDELVTGKIIDRDTPTVFGLKQTNSLVMDEPDTCDFKTKSKKKLQHRSKHKEARVYKCDTCDYTTKYNVNLTRHQLKHKDFSEVDVYKCEACDYITKFKRSFMSHQLKHKDISEVQIHKCDTCDYKTKYKSNLRDHELKHKAFSEVSMHKCNTCDFKTRYKTSLRNHQLGHKGPPPKVRPYKCDLCDYKATRKNTLMRHQLKHKDVSEVQVYKCDACDYRTKHKSNLKQHHQLKHKSFPEVPVYKSDGCDYKTEPKDNLMCHEPKNKDFPQAQKDKLNVYDDITQFKGNLIIHQLKPKDCSGVQVYQCDACDFKAKNEKNITGHQQIHKDN